MLTNSFDNTYLQKFLEEHLLNGLVGANRDKRGISGVTERSDVAHVIVQSLSICTLERTVDLHLHILGVGKYRQLGIEYPLKKVVEVSDRLLEEVKAYCGDIPSTVGG